MIYNIWRSGKNIVSTTWGTDWDSCSTANHVIITLDPSLCYILEVSIITKVIQQVYISLSQSCELLSLVWTISNK